MFTNEKMLALRDPEFRAQLTGFDHPAGLIDEDELKEIVGASEVNPNTNNTSILCPITITIFWPCNPFGK